MEEIILRATYLKAAPYSMQCKIRFIKENAVLMRSNKFITRL